MICFLKLIFFGVTENFKPNDNIETTLRRKNKAQMAHYISRNEAIITHTGPAYGQPPYHLLK
jgi:hypothetical protein